MHEKKYAEQAIYEKKKILKCVIGRGRMTKKPVNGTYIFICNSEWLQIIEGDVELAAQTVRNSNGRTNSYQDHNAGCEMGHNDLI